MYDSIFKINLEHQGNINKIIFGYLTHPVIDWFYQNNFTPNIITTLSFISQLISINYLLKFQPMTFSFFYFLGYYFDCIDGPMARKYNMVTLFGDWYDHITDMICFSWIIYILINQYSLLEHNFICIILLVYLLGLIGYVGSQEKIYNKNNKDKQISYSLYFTTFFIKDEYRFFKYYKFFCFTNSVVLFSIIPNFLSY